MINVFSIYDFSFINKPNVKLFFLIVFQNVCASC